MDGKLLMGLSWSKSIEVYHPDIAHILRMSAGLIPIASGFGYIEGLLWHKGGFLIFSDQTKNKIYKYSKLKGVEIFFEVCCDQETPTSASYDHVISNGIAYDSDNNIVFCQNTSHAIIRIHKDGSIEQLVDEYEGKQLNCPSHLAILSDGSIYFTATVYGSLDQPMGFELSETASAIYKWNDGHLVLVASELENPKALCFSPDHQYMYIANNSKDKDVIFRCQLDKGQLKSKKDFIQESTNAIKTDVRGNLFLATHHGVKIYSAEGCKLGMIKTPASVNNLCIEGNTLYIGTAHKIFRFALRSK